MGQGAAQATTGQRPRFVIDRNGQIKLAQPEGPQQPAPAPTLGLNPPQGPAPQGMPSIGEIAGDVLPTLMGILAAPFTGGMSLPAAAATTGGAAAAGEMVRQRVQGEEFDPVAMGGEGLWGALPTPIARGGNTTRRGTRMIRNTVAEGQPVRSAERLTEAAIESGVNDLSTPAINKIVKQTVDLENSLYDAAGKVKLPPAQAQAVKAKIKQFEELVTRLRSIPATEKSSGMRARLSAGGPAVTMGTMTNPAGKLKRGQALVKAGKPVQWSIEGALRALLLNQDLNESIQEDQLEGLR